MVPKCKWSHGSVNYFLVFSRVHIDAGRCKCQFKSGRDHMWESHKKRRIKELLGKSELSNAERGALGSLLNAWAVENDLPVMFPRKRKDDGGKGKRLGYLIELWKLHNNY